MAYANCYVFDPLRLELLTLNDDALTSLDTPCHRYH